jgi:hypothetical protein
LHENNNIEYLKNRIDRANSLYWNFEYYITTPRLNTIIGEILELNYLDIRTQQNYTENADDYIIKYRGFVSQIIHEFKRSAGQTYKYGNGINILSNKF